MSEVTLFRTAEDCKYFSFAESDYDRMSGHASYDCFCSHSGQKNEICELWCEKYCKKYEPTERKI